MCVELVLVQYGVYSVLSATREDKERIKEPIQDSPRRLCSVAKRIFPVLE